MIYDNIIYGFATGVGQSTAQYLTNSGGYNDFFNNTSDVSNYTKSSTDLALNPNFTSAGQITGTTATSSASVLTDSSANFNTSGFITDNISVLHVLSGTGVTVANYLITAHTNTTLTTNNALGTSVAGNIVYFVPYQHNFLTTNSSVKGSGFPGPFGTVTTGFATPGAVQASSSGGGSSPGRGYIY